MRVTLVTLLAAAAAVSAQATTGGPTINTPSSLLHCIPSFLSWSSGTPPYFVTVNQGGSESNVLQTLLTSTNLTSYTWNVTAPVGTSVTLAVRDSTGRSGFSQQVTIAPGAEGCSANNGGNNGGSGGNGGTTSGGSGPSTSTPQTPPSTSAPNTSTSTTPPSSSVPPPTSSAPAPSTSAPPNAAGMNVANAGAALGIAAIAAAFL